MLFYHSIVLYFTRSKLYELALKLSLYTYNEINEILRETYIGIGKCTQRNISRQITTRRNSQGTKNTQNKRDIRKQSATKIK